MLKFSEYCRLMQTITYQAPRRVWLNICLVVLSIVLAGKISLLRIIDTDKFLVLTCVLTFLFLALQYKLSPRPAAKIELEQRKYIYEIKYLGVILPSCFAIFFALFESAKEYPFLIIIFVLLLPISVLSVPTEDDGFGG
jgi:hypothetical protein